MDQKASAPRGPAPRIQSVHRVDMILQAISETPGGSARLTDIVKRTGLNKSTAFTLLETLEILNYVQIDAHSREYRLGRRLFEFAKRGERSLDVLGAARPLMFQLVAEAHESVSLAIPATFDAIIISTVEGVYGVRGARWEGHHVPYHASAVGKAILAFSPEPQREAAISAIDFGQCTEKTLTTKGRLENQLKTVAERGFALSLGEEELGANAVAAPILDRMDAVVGAMSIWGPASRLTESRLLEIGPRLSEGCRQLFEA